MRVRATAPLRVATSPTLGADSASARALAPARATRSISGLRLGAAPRLVVDAVAGTPRLAWEVLSGGVQHDGTPSRLATYVDARTCAVLRREGLYSSHVIEWTRARDAGALTGVADSRRLGKQPKKSAEAVELERLRARNAKLEAELTKTRTALDIMGKAHALLEQLSESAEEKNPPRPSR